MAYFIRYTIVSALGRKVPEYFETSYLDKFVEALHRAFKAEFLTVNSYGIVDHPEIKEEYSFNPNT